MAALANGPAKIASAAPEITEKAALAQSVRRSRRSDETVIVSSLCVADAREIASGRPPLNYRGGNRQTGGAVLAFAA